jgi:eukaryotic-like serine/threonine-protein kinase
VDMSSSDPFGLIGQVLDGQFRVDALIGEGGFSAVYRGMHMGLDEPIALKCLKLQAALGPAVVTSLMTRFREESRLLYRLSQGNLDIVRSIASGTTVAPTTGAMVPYMVLEWLEGRSLAAELVVRRTQGAKGRPLLEAIAMLDSAVDALAYAHSLGVVHRDLNPGNLFLAQTRTGPRMKVLDFGVAKVMRDEILALGPRAQTLDSIRIFSPAYAAPEQFDDRIGAVSAATDVWSLAVILLEVMSDRPVFEGEALGEFFHKVLDPAYPRTPRPRGVSVGDATERVFARALAMSPLDRPKDAGVFWVELRNALSKDVGGSTVKSASNPFQPGVGMEPTQSAKVDQVVIVPAPVTMPSPMTTTARVDTFSYEPTVLTGALAPGASRPDTKPLVSMTDVKTTVRMAPSPPPAPAPTPTPPPPAPAPPGALFQGAAVQPRPGAQLSTTFPMGQPKASPPPPPPPQPQPEPSQSVAVPSARSNAQGILIAIVVAIVLIGAAVVAFAIYRSRIAP